jgi:hypothetical protein
MSEKYIKVDKISVEKGQISVQFSTSHKHLFRSSEFWAKYNVDVSDTPYSVAVVPFIVNVLPIAWLADLTIYVDELDKDFFEAIPEFKKGYINMYPMLSFKGDIVVGNLVQADRPNDDKTVGTLFSGGVDAFATLIAHADEHPDLITVQGSDIHLDETDAWNTVLKQNEKVCNDFNVKQLTISSNYCIFHNGTELNKLIYGSHENWWHGFQHGIGLLGLCAPYAYKFGYSTLYIASSYTVTDNATCASDPTIDNFVRYCGCKVVHDQYEYNRWEKTQHIAEFVERNQMKVFLRVCYMSDNGYNCCKCEKCLRTASTLQLLGRNIVDYGFDNLKMFRHSKFKVLTQVTATAAPLWNDIRSYAQSITSSELPNELKWIKSTDVPTASDTFLVNVFKSLKYRTNRLRKKLFK